VGTEVIFQWVSPRVNSIISNDCGTGKVIPLESNIAPHVNPGVCPLIPALVSLHAFLHLVSQVTFSVASTPRETVVSVVSCRDEQC
jgi:hypothetical protein